MKNLLILFILLTACEKEVKYYPSKDFFYEYNPNEIQTRNLSYGQLVDSIGNQLYKRKRTFITITDKNKEHKISLFTYSGGLIKEKNALKIEIDSIWWGSKKKSINELTSLIELHYGNEGKEYFLPDSYKNAFVKLTLDSLASSKEYNKKILYIIKSFNKTEFKNKESCNLDILVHYNKDFKSQPIPPQPNLIEIENE